MSWKTLSTGTVLLGLIFPLLVLASLWWGWHLIRGFGHLLDDDHLVPTVAGTIFFGVLLVIGLTFTLVVIVPGLQQPVIESACPCCGKVEARNFGEPNKDLRPIPCGVCDGYLRIQWSDLSVTEENVDASDMEATPYRLSAKRYARSETFQMPASCSICGAEAHAVRPMGTFRAGPKPGAGLYDVVESAASYALADGANGVSRRHTTPPGPSKEELLDAALLKHSVPVCEKHQHESFGEAMRASDGDLCFASYQYYKAFIALNHIELQT